MKTGRNEDFYYSDYQDERSWWSEFNRKYFHMRKKKNYLCDQQSGNKFDFIT